MQAHALTCAMEHAIGSSNYDGGDISYPFLTLLVSGKHVGSPIEPQPPLCHVLTKGMSPIDP